MTVTTFDRAVDRAADTEYADDVYGNDSRERRLIDAALIRFKRKYSGSTESLRTMSGQLGVIAERMGGDIRDVDWHLWADDVFAEVLWDLVTTSALAAKGTYSRKTASKTRAVLLQWSQKLRSVGYLSDEEARSWAAAIPPAAMSPLEPLHGQHIPDVVHRRMLVNCLQDSKTAKGVRDYAICESFYTCGMRVHELTGISTPDPLLAQRQISLNSTKGNRPRIAYLNDTASFAIFE